MEIIRSGLDVTPGRGDRFTGDVQISRIVQYLQSGVLATNMHFEPGARTAWHAHPEGETVYVTGGAGYCQRHGEPIEILRRGDQVSFAPGERHWLGAAPATTLDHISLINVDEDNSDTDWSDLVTHDEYSEARRSRHRELRR